MWYPKQQLCPAPFLNYFIQGEEGKLQNKIVSRGCEIQNSNSVQRVFIIMAVDAVDTFV